MEKLFDVDWRQMFVPETSVLEMMVRGTIMYFGMLIALRVFRRQAGSVSMADLLVIIIIADAAQNGMAGDAKSVVEAMALIFTIVAWDWILDWLGFKSQMVKNVIDPQPLVVVKNGRIIKKNLDSEMLTEDDLMSHLKQKGVDDISKVRECRIESNGEFSVVLEEGLPNQDNKKKTGDVN